MMNSIEEIFQEICEKQTDLFDIMLTMKTMDVMCEMMEESGKDDCTKEELEEIYQAAIVSAMDSTVTGEEGKHLFHMAANFDRPDKWYYDLQLAVKYYLLSVAVEQNPRASYNLGCIYFNGQIDEKHNFEVKKDYSLAAAYYSYAVLYRKNFMEESPKYLYCLAEMYFYGWGVKQDFFKVIELANKNVISSLPPYSGKLENLCMTAMNIKDSVGGVDSRGRIVVPSELLDRVDVSVGQGFQGEVAQQILNSPQAKVETLMRRRAKASSGEYTYKCPVCGADMVAREAKNNANNNYSIFLGCTAYPNCKQTVSVLPYLFKE